MRLRSKHPSHLLAAALLAGCVASPGPLTDDRHSPPPAFVVPGPSPAPTTQVPAVSLPPYEPPRFDAPLPATRAGWWAPQELAPTGSPGPLPVPSPGLPAAAETAYRFVAPTGVTLPIGDTVRLQLTDGCGSVYWGALDPDSAAMTADGTLWPRRPGAVQAFAEQDGQRRYLQVAVSAVPAPGQRFGPPAGWTFDDDAEQLAVITDRAAFEALWRTHVVAVQALRPRGWNAPPPSLPPAPPAPAIDFKRHAVVVVAMQLQSDEADPVLTHIDLAGVHAVVPSATGATIDSRRRTFTLFRVPAMASTTPIDVVRPDPSRPLPSPPAPEGATSSTPIPRPLGAEGDCPPDWAWAMSPRDVSLEVGDASSGTDSQGLPAPLAAHLAIPVGGALRLIGRSARGPLAWSLADPALAALTADPYGIPVASAPAALGQPPASPPPPGIPAGTTLVARAPGVVQVTVSAGGAQARALIATVATQAPALRFRFPRGGGIPAEGLAAGTRVMADEATWHGFWDRTFPQMAGDAPPVDFATYNVVAWIEDRITYGERGEAVLVGVGPGGREVHLVAPGVESHLAPPRHRRAVSLFLTGRLAPGTKVRTTTLCDPGG